MFKQIDSDGDESISLSEFKAIFMQKFVCIKEVTVTEGLQVAKSKTTCKIESGTVLETIDGPQTDESNGMVRVECTVVSSGKTGFVTMQGNQGTKFIELISPFTTFSDEVDKVIEETLKGLTKVAAFFTAKGKELLTAGKDGPLAEARTELGKLRPRVSGAQDKLRKLKMNVANGKK